MNHELVLATITKSQIGILTLNRPEKHNAFNHKMIADITQKLHFFSQQPIRFLIINANGNHFCAGGDLNWMQDMATLNLDDNIADASELAKMLHLIHQFEKPTIALIQGMALGGGAGIVSACDMAISESNAQFGFTETRLGLIPATIGPYVVHSIGSRWANYYFLTARIFDAETAFKIGLCHEIVSLEQLLNIETLESIQALIKNGPVALTHAKKLVKVLKETKLSDPKIISMTANMLAQMRASHEGREGISAFIEKRQPNWIMKS